MKWITVLMIAAGTLVVVVGLAIAFMPTLLVVSTEATILAPQTLVYEKVNHQSQFHTWSPWLQQDPQSASLCI